MHSDPAEVQKTVRKYYTIGGLLLVCTVITVAASYLNLAVPAAIAVALIIAATKGSLVASVFMHLSYERKWIYGCLLLTVFFFLVLLFIPLFTVADGLGTGVPWSP